MTTYDWASISKDWWAEDGLALDSDLCTETLDEKEPWDCMDPKGLLPFEPDEELLFSHEISSPEAPAFSFEGVSDLGLMPLESISYDTCEESSHRGAFKESFINGSRCQSPVSDTSAQTQESPPSSSSMIALRPHYPHMAFRVGHGRLTRMISSKHSLNMGIAGCQSSTDLRQLSKVKVEGSRSTGIVEECVTDDVSDAESDLNEAGCTKIDLRCKGETLDSDSEDSLHDTIQDFAWTSFKNGGMEFIPVSNDHPSNISCASATDSVGSLKRLSSPTSKGDDEQIQMRPAKPVQPTGEPITLTDKLSLSLRNNARGPVTSTDVQVARAMPPPPPLTLTRPGRKTKLAAKKDVGLKKPATKKQTASAKKVLKDLPAKVEPQPRRRAGRPKKLTALGAEFKSSQSAKRRRASGKTARSSNGQGCTQCSTHVTPVWRHGPDGPKTLCNACGVRYMKVSKRK